MHLANVFIHAFERGSVSICQAVLIWGGTPRPAQGGCLRWCRRTDRSFRVAVCDFHENSIKHTCLVALVSGDTLRMPASGGLLPRIRWALASWGAWAPRQAAVLVRCLCSQAACFSTCQHWMKKPPFVITPANCSHASRWTSLYELLRRAGAAAAWYLLTPCNPLYYECKHLHAFQFECGGLMTQRW